MMKNNLLVAYSSKKTPDQRYASPSTWITIYLVRLQTRFKSFFKYIVVIIFFLADADAHTSSHTNIFFHLQSELSVCARRMSTRLRTFENSSGSIFKRLLTFSGTRVAVLSISWIWGFVCVAKTHSNHVANVYTQGQHVYSYLILPSPVANLNLVRYSFVFK
jgi:hypothetical protein